MLCSRPALLMMHQYRGSMFSKHHNFVKRSLSSTSSSSSSKNSSTRSRLAIGGSKIAQQNTQDGIYPSVIATAIANSISTFESGFDGDEKLTKAYIDAFVHLQSSRSSGNDNNNNTIGSKIKGIELTGRFGYKAGPMDSKCEDDILQEGTMNTNDGDGGEMCAFHNMSTLHVQQSLEHSPLVHLYQGKLNSDSYGNLGLDEEKLEYINECRDSIQLTYMAHNPEAQGSEMHIKGAPIEDIREFTKERMTQAFIGLERGVAEGQITSYGVCSNGLSLPSSHPMHLSWEDMLKAANDAAGIVHNSSSNANAVANLSMVQLPINLLETHGMKVANRIKNYLASPQKEEESSLLPSSIRVFAMRPLTCYPGRGVGNEHPFKLVDYLIPTSLNENDDKTWTHNIEQSSPLSYTAILNETMAHFDATHILEIKEEEERKLTMEERETLDGCKLIQSMIHDLDANLSSGQLRSFAAYEEDLYSKAIPLIHDTFEELDADSADLLQRFFQAHGNAVRHSIAKTTRQLVKEGGDGVEKYNIPDDWSLQEFALGYLWKQQCEGDFANGQLIDKVVVGCPKLGHVVELVEIADKVQSLMDNDILK